MKYTFKVVAQIKGKARPRFNTKTGVAYKVKEDKVYENQIRSSFLDTGQELSDKYIRMTLDMYFKIPKSYSKKRREACLKGIERPAKKPDVDNIVKNICDALNGYAYKDDVQVIEVVAKKYYTDKEEYIQITIEEI